MLVYVVMAGVLVWRPDGLFGQPSDERSRSTPATSSSALVVAGLLLLPLYSRCQRQ